jgi:hypothetical protein
MGCFCGSCMFGPSWPQVPIPFSTPLPCTLCTPTIPSPRSPTPWCGSRRGEPHWRETGRGSEGSRVDPPCQWQLRHTLWQYHFIFLIFLYKFNLLQYCYFLLFVIYYFLYIYRYVLFLYLLLFEYFVQCLSLYVLFMHLFITD